MTAEQSDRASNVVLAPHDGNACADAKSEFVAEMLSRAGRGR